MVVGIFKRSWVLIKKCRAIWAKLNISMIKNQPRCDNFFVLKILAANSMWVSLWTHLFTILNAPLKKEQVRFNMECAVSQEISTNQVIQLIQWQHLSSIDYPSCPIRVIKLLLIFKRFKMRHHKGVKERHLRGLKRHLRGLKEASQRPEEASQRSEEASQRPK